MRSWFRIGLWFLMVVSIPACAAQNNFTVVQVTEYCRHGARTTWRDHMHLDLTKNLGLGTLTANGMRMHHLLGKELRNRYTNLLGEQAPHPLRPLDVEVFASNVARTQLSAQSQLSGLMPFGTGPEIFEPNRPDLYNPNFQNVTVSLDGSYGLPQGYSPVPLILQAPELDVRFLADPAHTCPHATSFVANVSEAGYKKYQYFPDKLALELETRGFSSRSIYNKSAWDIESLALLSDELICYENYHGFRYNNTDPTLQEKIFRAHNVKFTLEFDDIKIKKFRSDAIARDIIQGMDNVVTNKTNKKKFRLFSGHDTGVLAHMLLLNLTNLDCMVAKMNGTSVEGACEDIPAFAAQFIYELVVNNKNEYFVRSLYNNVAFNICPRKEYCPYDEFKEKFEELVFMDKDDFLRFCGNQLLIQKSQHSQRPKIVKPLLFWITAAVGGVLILLVILMIVARYQRILVEESQKRAMKASLGQSNEADHIPN